jgi:hypothetical protein
VTTIDLHGCSLRFPYGLRHKWQAAAAQAPATLAVPDMVQSAAVMLGILLVAAKRATPAEAAGAPRV